MNPISLKLKKSLKYLLPLLIVLILFIVKLIVDHNSQGARRYVIPEKVAIITLSDQRTHFKGKKGDFETRVADRKRKLQITGIDIESSDSIKKHPITSVPFPYRGLNDEIPHLYPVFLLRNAVSDIEKGIFTFLNCTNDSQELFTMRIRFTQIFRKENLVDLKHIKKMGIFSRGLELREKVVARKQFKLDEGAFTSANSDGTQVINHMGFIINVSDDTTSDFCSDREKSVVIDGRNWSMKRVLDNYNSRNGAKFLTDNSVIVKLGGIREEERVGNLVCDPCLLILYSKDDNHNPIALKTGFNNIIPMLEYRKESPIDISPGRNIVAFQAIYPDASNIKAYLWLSVWNLKTNTTEKICRLSPPIDELRCIKDAGEFFAFNPNIETNLIAVSSYENIKLIDIKEKKVLKKIPIEKIKNMRWSPDGKKLGILKNGEYEYLSEGMDAYRVTTPPSLWIYDLEKDQLEKIDEDPGYFDFFWVP